MEVKYHNAFHYNGFVIMNQIVAMAVMSQKLCVKIQALVEAVSQLQRDLSTRHPTQIIIHNTVTAYTIFLGHQAL